MPQIICATCQKQFEPCVPNSSDQGYGCSVEVCQEDGRLLATGYYGSFKFDGDEIDLTHTEVKPNVGLACDDCIQTAVEKGGKITGNYLNRCLKNKL
ncbi:MAG: hypothetical protein KW788_01460 [Candidatus Doudnabacteria bacterium]|nr:hypothetical protein [Candidatus Doudnabacteria bacterium]